MLFSSLGGRPEAPACDDPAPLIRAGFLLLAGFVFGFGGWAALTPLQSAVVAAGVVAVEGERQPVQHRDGGLVRAVLVREGERVTQGQALLSLDVTEAQASLDVLAAQHDRLLLRESRLVAESGDAQQPLWPAALEAQRAEPGIARLLAEEAEVFFTRRAAFHGEQDLIRQKVHQLKTELAGAVAQRTSRLQQLALIRKELEGQQELFDKGYARKTRMYELERAVAGLEGAVAEEDAAIARSEEQIRTAIKEEEQIRRRRAEDVATDLKDTRQKLAEILPRIDSLRHQIGRATLTAPRTGTVLGLTVTGSGAVVPPAGKVLDIVPATEAVSLDVQIHPEDIEDVQPGMHAEIQLLAFKDMTLPEVYGRVSWISADRIVDPRSGQPYYQVRIQVEDSADFHRLGLKLQPGMPVSVLLPGKARSVLNYLIWPLRQQLAGAFREK